MATAVLGKRSRRVLDKEDISLPLPARKRHTPLLNPRIYEDNTESTQNHKHQAAKAKHLSRSQNCIDENSVPFVASTPTSNRFKNVIETGSPSTPKHRVRLAGKIFTPRSNRLVSTPKSQSVFATARQLFNQACNPTKLVGRDAERDRLQSFISTAINSNGGGSLYVSGPPGTGKSALVQEIFQQYESESTVKVAVVNCVAVRSANEVLGKITEVFCSDASNNRKFTKEFLAQTFKNNSRSGPQSYLLLLDEMDSLLDADCEVLYTIFDWALHPSSSLILIGIANALDLTDRFLPRLKMRNLKPELLPFMPYSATQITEIITEKLRSLLPADHSAPSNFVPLMQPAAIQLSGKKIASQTGDLRKAFNLVRRVIDQVEREAKLKESDTCEVTPTKQPLAELPNLGTHLPLVTSKIPLLSPETAPRASVAHVARIAAGIFNNGAQTRLSALNLQQKAVLCSLVATENKRPERDPYMTPSKASSRIPTIAALFEKYSRLCQRDEGCLQTLKPTEFRDVVASLETLGLVHESTGRPTGLLTPTQTPSRIGRNFNDRQVVSAVSEKEMRESLTGPGGELLQRLFDE